MATQPPPVPGKPAEDNAGHSPQLADLLNMGGARGGIQPALGKVEGPRITTTNEDVPLAIEEEPVEVLNFWQQPFAQNVLPFLTSLVMHLTFVGIILLIVGPVQDIIARKDREQIIVPDAEMVSEGPEGGIPHPGLGGDPTLDAKQNKVLDVPTDAKGFADKAGPTLQVQLMGGGDNDTGPSLIGTGSGGYGKGNRFGSGTGDGTGQLAPFGTPGGGSGIGPKSNFIGLGGNARRVAYVCDASGSMMSMFDSLRVEIRKSVDNLKPVQSFNIVFFKEDSFSAMDKVSLRMATPDNKRLATTFLEGVNASGSTDPIPALKLAFSLKPELIYLLTDGDFQGPGNEAVVKFCKEQTIDGKVKINTIAFIASQKDNAQDLEFVKALQAIAKNSGGRFKNVSDEDMGGK